MEQVHEGKAGRVGAESETRHAAAGKEVMKVECTGPAYIPPTPTSPRPPVRPGGFRPYGLRAMIVAALTASLVTTAVVFSVPLLLGGDPLDVLRGKAEVSTVREVQTVKSDNVLVEQADVAGAASKILPCVVNIEVRTDSGFMSATSVASGFIYGADGYIVTNNHVVEGAGSIKVSVRDGSTYVAEVVGTDPDSDLAVIRIDASGLPAAVLGSSSSLAVGDPAIAVGSPEGFEGSVTSGIISALDRTITISGREVLYGVIQTDAAINPGNSGGPLCNIAGEVVGINTAIYSESGGYDGLGFAIPIDSAKPVIEELISRGFVSHPWLGFSGVTLDEGVAERYRLPVSSGAMVRETVSGAPAQKAGLQPGDIIVSIDGAPIDSMEACVAEVRRHAVGDEVELGYYRGGELRHTKAILEEKPRA